MKSALLTFVVIISIVIPSCKKDPTAPPTPTPTQPTVDTPTTLKAAASFPVGIAIEYALFKNNPAYKNVVTTEADQVTLVIK